MPPMQDTAITNIPTIIGIMATDIIIRILGLVTVTEIMAAIEAVIPLIGDIMAMEAIGEGTETTSITGMEVIAAAIMAASIDRIRYILALCEIRS
jgi:hypothetical protein